MNNQEIKRIEKCVKKYLYFQHRNNHYDDCFQYTCLELLKNPKRKNYIKEIIIDYLRINGLVKGERNKSAQATIGTAKSLDSTIGETSTTLHEMITDEKVVYSEVNYKKTLIEKFCFELNLTKEVTKWVIKNYKKAQ